LGLAIAALLPYWERPLLPLFPGLFPCSLFRLLLLDGSLLGFNLVGQQVVFRLLKNSVIRHLLSSTLRDP
jgi:hypothetical protein